MHLLHKSMAREWMPAPAFYKFSDRIVHEAND